MLYVCKTQKKIFTSYINLKTNITLKYDKLSSSFIRYNKHEIIRIGGITFAKTI